MANTVKKTAAELVAEDKFGTAQALIYFLNQRMRIREAQEELGAELLFVNRNIIDLMHEADITGFVGEEGTLVYKSSGISKNFNRERFITNLLQAKVDAKTIADCKKTAFDEKSKPATVSFYKAGEKEDAES